MKKEIGFSSQSCSPALHNLISIEELSSGQIESLLNNAQAYAAADFGKAVGAPYLGQTQINLFFENSTRTRSSFEIAGQRLGLDIVNIDVAHSSIKKGESLSDTAINLNAMQPSIVVVRHNQSGAAKFLTSYFDCPLINAGDGAHEHPTQALLDALTIRQGKGRLKGLTIAICGDILHSRVARSNLFCLGLLGARLRFIAPSTLLPTYLAQTGVEVFHSMEEGLKNVDVIMMLRLQNERMDGAFFPSPREYYHFFSLNEKRLQIAKPDCLVLHPGPINRGVEIASSVVDGAHSLIRKQVENGVAIRMAVLATLLEANKKKLHPGKRKKA